jgi:RHS repeat-associated protein
VDNPFAVRRSSDGAVFYYAEELPGHVAGLISTSGQVVNTYEYDPWGQPLGTTEQVSQPLRYGAREYDTETGFYYNRARYYDPQLGRFISEDPIELAGGINPFVYVDDNRTRLERRGPGSHFTSPLTWRSSMRRFKGNVALVLTVAMLLSLQLHRAPPSSSQPPAAPEAVAGGSFWTALACAGCAAGAIAIVSGGWGAILAAAATEGSTLVAAACIGACVETF